MQSVGVLLQPGTPPPPLPRVGGNQGNRIQMGMILSLPENPDILTGSSRHHCRLCWCSPWSEPMGSQNWAPRIKVSPCFINVYRIYLRHPGWRVMVYSSFPAFCLVFISLFIQVYYLFIELCFPLSALSLSSFIMFSGPFFLLSAYFVFNTHSKLLALMLDHLSSSYSPRNI